MPSGSISQQPERPDANKRHAQVPQTGYQHASDDVEHMPAEELAWQMDKTIDDILFLTRRYMNQYNARWEKTGQGYWGTGQMSVAWYVGFAHWEGGAEEIREQHRAMTDALNNAAKGARS